MTGFELQHNLNIPVIVEPWRSCVCHCEPASRPVRKVFSGVRGGVNKNDSYAWCELGELLLPDGCAGTVTLAGLKVLQHAIHQRRPMGKVAALSRVCCQRPHCSSPLRGLLLVWCLERLRKSPSLSNHIAEWLWPRSHVSVKMSQKHGFKPGAEERTSLPSVKPDVRLPKK